MVVQIENCQSCPLACMDRDGYSICQHPTIKEEMICPKDGIHTDCPLKVVDLILTIKK